MSTPSSRRVSRSLRGRVMVTFALGAALLSLVLAWSVHTVSRSYLTEQREVSARRQANGDAEFVRARLGTSAAPREILADLNPPRGTVALLRADGRWYSSQPGIGQEHLPSAVRGADSGRETTVTPMTIAGVPHLAVGTPAGAGARFYEMVPLRELKATLAVVRKALVTCSVIATIAAALVGLAVSRRLLRPLRQVADTAVRVADGHLDTRVPAARDRELAMISDAVNRMVDSLQRRIERERRFFGDVSHELRTPLTTLVTAVGVLSRHRPALPGRAGEAFDLVVTEVDHLRRLLDHLLALARAEAGLHQDQLEPLSLGELVGHLLTEYGRPSAVLTVEEDSVVRGRRLALERAFANLLANADRHGGGLTGVTVGRTGDDAVVFVDDAGPGVPPEDREAIFERFTTGATEQGDTAGTGLGLALVAETVRAHHGRVRCTDRPGGGTRMIVTVPVSDADEPAPRADRAS